MAARRSDLLALGTYAPEPGTMAAYGALFVATQCEGTPRRPTMSWDIAPLHSSTARQMEELIAAGEIAHCATLLLYYRFCQLQR